MKRFGLSPADLLGLRFAINVALATVIVWTVLRALDVSNPIWAIASMIAASDPQVEEAARMFRSRLINVLVGCVVGLAFLSVAVLGSAGEQEPEWHPAAAFDLEGRGWTDTEAPYDRLPAHAKGKAPDDVWDESKASSGELIRFQTDAAEVRVRWSLTESSLAMPHMPATGVSG
jgi:hypothetical protein